MQDEPRDSTVPVPLPDSGQVPSNLPWGKIAAVVLFVLVIVAAIAVIVRPQNHPPIINRATVSSGSGAVADLITFAAQATDPDSDSLSYQWDFGDGTTSTGDMMKHAYTLPGQFVALLTVSDGKGGQTTNDKSLLYVHISPKPADLIVAPCTSANCKPGPVVAVLDGDHSATTVGMPVTFIGNGSWAYAFSWTNSSNHSAGGRYSPEAASNDSSLFAFFRYVWGDGSENTTGTSNTVGRTIHSFAAPGNYFVRLTVTYVQAELNPSTKSASAGYTVRVTSAPPTYAASFGLSHPSEPPQTGATVFPTARIPRVD